MPTDTPPPRRATSPRRRAPAGACDCHMHIFGPADRFPYAEGRGYTPPDALLPAYHEVCATLGIVRTVVVQPSVYGTDNRCTLEAVRALGPSGRGVAVVDGGVGDALLAELAAAGFRRTRFNLVNGPVDAGQLRAVAAKVAPLGWHVQVFATGRMLADMAPALAALPCPVVVDHHGMVDGPAGPQFDALARLLDNGRTWVKVSGAYRLEPDGAPAYPRAAAVARALIARAAERVVWGTDWPHPALAGPMPDDGALFDVLLDCVPDDATLKRILVDNPARLYGFTDAP